MFVFCFLFVCLHFYIFVERERWEGQEAQERIPSRFHSQTGAQHGAWSHKPRIMTWAEIKSQIFNLLSHPGTPLLSISYDFSYCELHWHPTVSEEICSSTSWGIWRISALLTVSLNVNLFIYLLSFTPLLSCFQSLVVFFVFISPYLGHLGLCIVKPTIFM